MHDKRRFLWIPFVILLTLMTAACEGRVRDRAGASLPNDTAPQTITVGKHQRSYMLHVPAGYDPAQPAPLVFVFHGGGGNAKE